MTAVAAALLITASAHPAVAATTQVHIVGGAPSPAQITIDDGDFVTFLNDDDVAHAIFALGEQRGGSIPPHHTSDVYGPFHPENGGNTYPYRIDQDGPDGLIVVRSTDASTTSPPASSPSAFPSPTTGTTIASTTTAAPSGTTSPTLVAPITAISPPTTSSSATNSPAPVVVHEAKQTSPLLAVVGVALVSAGITGLLFGRFQSRRSH